MTTRQWPIDFDSLRIGSRVTADVIEAAFDVIRTDPLYRLKQLALTDMIRKRRPDLDTYLRANGLDIIVMDDAAAATHQRNRFTIAAKQVITTHRRNMGVDAAKLEESERRVHEGALYANGRLVSALDTERKKLQVEASKRTIPILGDD